MSEDRVKEIEKAAATASSCPKDLKPPEKMLYFMLLGVYASYQSGKIDKEQGHNLKLEAYSTYQRVKTDYEQYIKVSKQMQDKIRNGYNVGGVTVIPKEKNT